ncbi:hypothetical protein AB0K08_15200 [Citricoccus sp. NPDC055426]|uniref:hypothetical protein n=1 Tax=Citricoccus sp. NPDC055426 TaxID=3155536 RepID=UPI0034246551
MSNTPGRVPRLERVAYLLGLALLGVLGLAAAILGAVSLWSASLACLGLGLALLAPMSFLGARRQLKTFKAALRQIGGPPSGAGAAKAGQPDVAIREMVSMLSRTNRQLAALSERVDSLPGPAAGGPAESQELTVAVANLRSEVTALQGEQTELRESIEQGWTTVRADLQALSPRDR